MNDKLKLVTTVSLITIIVITGLYFIAAMANKKKKEKTEIINKRYRYAKGIITDYKSYKGHNICIKYVIDGKAYTYNGGWDHNPKRLLTGDSIKFRYAIDSPALIITELDSGF